MECVYESGDDQPEHIGGICTDGEVKADISIPGLDSLLAGFSTSTEVTGLNDIPSDERPPAPTLIHNAFDVMVGIGTLLFLLAAWFAIAWRRKRDLPGTDWFLRAAAIAGVAAVVALESGWIVTEVGRQPYIVHGFMRTSEAVTPAQGIWWVFGFTMALYAGLAVVAGVVLRGMARRWREEGAPEPEAPYSPPPTTPEAAR
jgi:cytochrome d ubiquinol oxidase subunit I